MPRFGTYISGIIKRPEWQTTLLYALLAAPAIVYMFKVVQYTVNVPIWDDYEVILHFISQWKTTPFPQCLQLLLMQQNEHRLVMSKLIYVLYYTICGTINFTSLVYIGNLQLLMAYGFLIAFLRQCLPRQWGIAGFLLGCCLFDLNNWQNANFAMAAMENYGVLLFFLASLYLFNTGATPVLPAAIILMICCVFSSGNGLIGAACLVLFNLFRHHLRACLYSGVAFALCIAVYFAGYTSPHMAPLSGSLDMTTYFFHFITAYADDGNFRVPVWAGVGFLSLLALLMPFSKKARLQRQALPLVVILIFLILSMATVSVLRSNVIRYIPSRYRLYSDLLPAFLFAFLMLKIASHNLKRVLAPIFLTLVLFVYCQDFRVGDYNFHHMHDLLLSVDYYDSEKNDAQKIATEACKLNIYCLNDHRSAKIIF